MAKKDETKTEAAPETTAVTVKETAPAPVVALQPSEAMLSQFAEVQENLATLEDARLPRMKMQADGIGLNEDAPAVKELEGTIMHVRRVNQYYEKPFDPANVQPPDCYSLDGITPAKDSPKLQAPKCAGCPKAEWGSNNRNKGKACRNMKPIYMLVGDDSIMPRQLTVPPTSLKAVNNFLLTLTERGIPYRKARVKIEAYKETPKDTYCRLRFNYLGKLDDQRAKDVEYLRSKWLPIMDKQLLEQAETEFDEIQVADAQAAPPKETKPKPSADAKGQF